MSCIITYKGQKYSEEQFKEYFINNKQEFATSIAKNKDVIDSFKRKMEGIDFVFSQSSELASIGSKAQYLQYLSTIFPNSKVKDIVYHHSDTKITEFKKEFPEGYAAKKGVSPKAKFFLRKPLKEEFLSKRSYLGQYLINTVNPNVMPVNADKSEKRDSGIKEGIQEALDNGQDGAIFDNIWDNRTWSDVIVVFEPEQIHVIGGKNDIQGFKDFVQDKQFQKLTAEEKAKTIDRNADSYFTKNNAFFIDHVTSEAMFDNIKSYLSFHYPGIKTYDDYRNYIFELNDKDTILNFINFVTKC